MQKIRKEEKRASLSSLFTRFFAVFGFMLFVAGVIAQSGWAMSAAAVATFFAVCFYLATNDMEDMYEE